MKVILWVKLETDTDGFIKLDCGIGVVGLVQSEFCFSNIFAMNTMINRQIIGGLMELMWRAGASYCLWGISKISESYSEYIYLQSKCQISTF